MDHPSDCGGVTPSWREKLPLSDPKGGGDGVQHRTPRRGHKSTIWGGALRAFRMATGMATDRAKTSITIGRNVVSGCNIGCNIRSSVMLHRFLAPDGGCEGVATK